MWSSCSNEGAQTTEDSRNSPRLFGLETFASTPLSRTDERARRSFMCSAVDRCALLCMLSPGLCTGFVPRSGVCTLYALYIREIDASPDDV